MKRLVALLFAAALAAATAAVAQQKPLVVGVDGTFAPHAMPKLGGGVEGFNIDLINEAGRRMGRKVEIFAAEFSGLIPAMQCGQDRLRRRADHGDAGAREAAALHRGLPQHLLRIRRGRAESPDLKLARRAEGQDRRPRTRARPTTSGCRTTPAKLGLKGAESYGTNADAMQAVISGRADAGLYGKHRRRVCGCYGTSKQLKLGTAEGRPGPGVGRRVPQGRRRAAQRGRGRARVHEDRRHRREAPREVVRRRSPRPAPRRSRCTRATAFPAWTGTTRSRTRRSASNS